jgi:hypothetical protein
MGASASSASYVFPASYAAKQQQADSHVLYARMRITDGLANRLFQLATLLGYCARSPRHVPVVYEHDIVSNPHGPRDACFLMFPQVRRLPRSRPHTRPETVFPEASYFAAEPLPLVDTDVWIKGFRQSVGYFSATCVPDFDAAARVYKYRSPATMFPGVDFTRAAFIHVRRGDFVGTPLETDLRQYFEACMNELLVLAPAGACLPSGTRACAIQPRAAPAYLLLFSNDQPWARAHVGGIMARLGTATQLVPEPLKPLADAEVLMTMAKCAAGGICSNSTLSWWGSFMCRLRTGANSYFPFPWMTAPRDAKFKVDYPPWARVVNLFTGTPVAPQRTEWPCALVGVSNAASRFIEPVGVHSVFAPIARKPRVLALLHPALTADAAERAQQWCNAWAPMVELKTGDWTHAPNLMETLQAYRFCACITPDGDGALAQLGVWEALLAGCIPIISLPSQAACASQYSTLPCVILTAPWSQAALDAERLAQWWTALRHFFEVAPARHAVLQRLSLEFWRAQIAAGTVATIPPFAIYA